MRKLLLGLVLLGLVGCGRGSATRPDDFAVRLREDGGMTPFSRNILLTSGVSEDETFLNGVVLRVQFELTETNLTALYEAVVDNRFDSIRADVEEGVYDRGGTSIGVQTSGEMVWVYDNGTSFVRERCLDEYEAIYAAAFQLVTAQPDAAAGSFTLTWDEKLTWGGWEIEVAVGGDYLGMTEPELMTTEVTVFSRNAAASYPITLSNSVNGNTATFTLDMSQHQQLFLSQESGEPVMVGGERLRD